MMYNIKAVALLLILFFGSTAVYAQDFSMQQPQAPEIEPVTDAEIKLFAKTFIDIQPVQQEAQMKMVTHVEESGMDVNRFAQIMSAVQQGESTDELEVSEDEMELFTGLMDVIVKMQDDADEEIEEIIDNSGFNADRFRDVYMAIQTNPETQERFIAAITELQEDDM